MAESQADFARPSKRLRSSDSENSSYERFNASLWLADGNIILISADAKGFRVHQSVLSNHSEFFADMFSLASPADGGSSESSEGNVPSLTLAENGSDVAWFLHYFYTPLFFVPGTRTPYNQLAGMLQMSTKYLCQQLRADVIRHLSMIYPPKCFIMPPPMLPICPALVPQENFSNHALLAIQMARENDIPSILPLAFYYAATIDPSVYVDLLPPLSHEDHRSLILGREKLSKAVFKIAWGWLLENTDDQCNYKYCIWTRYQLLQSVVGYSCRAARLFLSPMLHKKVHPLPPGKKQPEPDEVCLSCYEQWRDAEQQSYSTVWKRLPSYFGVGQWPENAPRFPWPEKAGF